MTFLSASISAIPLLVVIVLTRALAVHKLPKRTFVLLWCVAVVRLLVPISFSSEFSVFTLLDRFFFGGAAYATSTVPDTAQIAITTIQNVAAKPTPFTLPLPVMLTWLGGMVLCGAGFLVLHLRSRRQYAASLPVSNVFLDAWHDAHPLRRTIAVRQSDRIFTPLTYGIWRPVIVLPKAMCMDDNTLLSYVLTHETVHIRRFDVALKGLLAVTVCVHWFNPLVWLMLLFANRDIELSCDEQVIRENGLAARSSYALALIGLEETRNNLFALCSGFSRNASTERITAIMKTKKTSFPAVFLAILLVAGITMTFATTATAAPVPPLPRAAVNAGQTCSAALTLRADTLYTGDAGMVFTLVTEEGDTIVIGPYPKDGMLRTMLIASFYMGYQSEAARILTEANLIPNISSMLWMYDAMLVDLLEAAQPLSNGTYNQTVYKYNYGIFRFDTILTE